MAAPFVVKLKIVEGSAQYVGRLLFQGEGQFGHHLRKRGEFVGLVALDECHVTLLALVALHPIDRVR